MPLSAHDRPLRIESVVLRARDMRGLQRYYTEVLGFSVIEDAPEHVALGVDRRALLTLEAAPDATPDDPRQAGLYHVAYLLPARAALGAWLQHARALGLRLDGASDHGVSEALYLRDPEGNGIEIYVDRRDEDWPRSPQGGLLMTTAPADLRGLAAEASQWAGFPEGGGIGHVHLRVGDVSAAAAHYRERLGLELMFAQSAAVWMGSGGYHHHLAGNAWSSAGAGRRPRNMAGMSEMRMSAEPETFAALARNATRVGDILILDDEAAGRITISAR